NHGANAVGWLTGMYHDLLGRLPSNPEGNFWLTQLSLGLNVSQVALAFTTSAEREIIVLFQDFSQFLSRTPAPAEANFWLIQLGQGLRRDGLEVAIVGSDEYFLRHGNNNQSFVTSVYHDILNRAPSQTEINFWLAMLP